MRKINMLMPCVAMSSRNKTGVKGVFRVKWNKDLRWRIAIGHDRGEYQIEHQICFGRAVKRSKELRQSLHGQFARAA